MKKMMLKQYTVGMVATLTLTVVLCSRCIAEVPSFVNWTYDGVERQDNGPRSMITLNGWWRWQPIKVNAGPSDEWNYRKVPGLGMNFSIVDAKQRIIKPSGEDTDPCWVEREFTVPAEWRNKTVEFAFDNIAGDGEIYLDSKKLGYTWPLVPHAVALPKPYKSEPYRLTIRSGGGGVLSNVWLKAYPDTDNRITDSYLTTSVRRKEATIIAFGQGDSDAQVRVVVTDYHESGKVVKEAGPFPVQRDGDGWRVEQSFPWPDAKLWSLESPNLYYYYLELLDEKGAVLDRIFPIRFGFREIWTEGGYFMLNGRRVTITTDVMALLPMRTETKPQRSEFGRYCDEGAVHRLVRRWKDVGVNCAEYRGGVNADDDMLFRAADEEGFFISIMVFGQERDPQKRSTASLRQHEEDRTRYLVLAYRHSPCVPFWRGGVLNNSWDYAPSKLGEDYDTQELFGQSMSQTRELLHRLDPARISFAFSGGGKTEPVHSSMNYIGIHVDMQAQETWPSHWYQYKKKPLMTYEMGAPVAYVKEWYMRRSRGELTFQGALPFFMEVGAIYLGDEAYQIEPKERVADWLDRVAKGTNEPLPFKGASKVYEKVSSMFSRNLFRSWKTYGVNMGFWILVREMFEAPVLTIPAPQTDPRRAGYTPDRDISLPTYTAGPMTKLGIETQRALSPLLVYIGGPDGNFVYKDRAFRSGETIRKTAVMVSDYETSVTVKGHWQLVDSSGAVVLQGEITPINLAPGELAPARTYIEFKAPQVSERRDYVLWLTATADRPGSLTDEFPLTIFPAPAPVKLPQNMKVYLYDPVGDTAKLLKVAGVPFELIEAGLPDFQGSLLVVGRNALADPANAKKFARLRYAGMSYDFQTNVSNGMRVLVFEQGIDNIWGLNTEQVRWRHTFIRAPGHPVFAGLSDADFTYLRGDSDLVNPYPEPPPMRPRRISGDRFPRWGSENVVVTYAISKPQLGAARALLDCGFDLQETPLLEVAGGFGRMMFCQVDVTNRYGTDPVSTQLVNNLLTYMATAPAPNPVVGKPTDLVREGLDISPLDVKSEHVFMTDRPEGPISWGISAADNYFEGYLDLPLIQGQDGKKYLYYRPQGLTQIVHTLNPRNFKTRWQRMKAMIMQSALRINQGGTSETYPVPDLQGDRETLYPMDWLEGFVHPYLLMQW